jgi:polyphenol oxidase
MSSDWRKSDRHAVEAELPGGGRALFTTRAGGNLSLAAGRGHEQGRDVRERICQTLSLRWLCAGPQVHGASVHRIATLAHSGGQPLTQPADGHATALQGVGVMVLAADCVPVALGTQGAVAAVHAGWRGLAAGVLEEGVRALRELALDAPSAASSDPDGARAPEARPERELAAVIGPCAGPCCYEVGAEVFEALGLPAPSGASNALLDLPALARKRLQAAGVEVVSQIERCTICDSRLFSHRREGGDAGRQAAVAWRP